MIPKTSARHAREPDTAPAPSFRDALARHGTGLARAPLRELQINVGRLCNQACSHCHVDAGPKRTEIMTWNTMARILAWTRAARVRQVDITGGAPELNPGFRRLVDGLRDLGAAVTARCNLTVLLEPGQEDLGAWYAARRIRLVASLPCYTRENVDAQRGDGVFARSIEALTRLNRLGYGRDPELVLDLVYNPNGAFLPGNQARLEAAYKARLGQEFGIAFNRLLTLANLPINRFARFLHRTGRYDDYLRLLADNFNPATVPQLMCRHLVSVDWTGRVYDCDFNQMLDLPLGGRARYLWELDPATLEGARIATGSHCFGCTAGAGSSCGGALT
jgi:radical SAM/Cys-rich protein